MKRKPKSPAPFTSLRRRAEARNKHPATQDGLAQVDSDTVRLVHELQVHQIELEIQNEDLQRSRSKVEDGLVHYTELYDFAPVGYFTLAKDGTIFKVNLHGAQILQTERANLEGKRFGLFVAEKNRVIFAFFLEKLFESHVKETCELELLREDE
jgi:hypothetical protein